MGHRRCFAARTGSEWGQEVERSASSVARVSYVACSGGGASPAVCSSRPCAKCNQEVERSASSGASSNKR